MNLELKKENCSCGRRHGCDIEAVFVECGAIARLGELCRDYEKILVIADENTFRAAGEQTLLALSGKKVETVVFGGSRVLIPDEAAIARVRESLGDSELIVGIGSGVIQDLSKYVAHFAAIPYMVVATAPSMDGYASTGAAMILDGMKETVPAGVPRAVVADTDVLKNAPLEMIIAGWGDIIGKYSALADWRLSEIVNGEYLCPEIYETTREMIERVRGIGKRLLERDGEAVGILMEALITVGVMMSFTGSSRPASGSEHHLSHFFEIVGIVRGEPYFPHGIDVAYSTVVTTELRERILSSPFSRECYAEERSRREARILEVYGERVGRGCIALQKRIGAYETDRLSVYLEREEEIRRALSEMSRAEEIRSMLLEMGLDMKEFYSLYGREKVSEAVRFAMDLKDRYTVLRLYYDLLGGESVGLQ